MNHLQQLGYTALILPLLLVAFWALGWLWWRLWRVDSLLDKGERTLPGNLLIYSLCGMLLCIVLYATLRSGGKTSQLFFLLLWLLFYPWLRSTARLSLSPESVAHNRQTLLPFWFGISASILFAWGSSWLFFGKPGAQGILPCCYSAETTFNAWGSYYLGKLGIENTASIRNLLEPEAQGLVPYHYPELWLSSLLARSFGLSDVVGFAVLVRSLLLVYLSLAYLAILYQLRGRHQWWFWPVVLLAGICPSLEWSFYLSLKGIHPSWLNNISGVFSSAHEKIKTTTFHLAGLSTVYALLRWGPRALAVSLLWPVVNVLALPVVYTAYCLYYLWAWAKGKLVRRQALQTLGICLGLFFLQLLFYGWLMPKGYEVPGAVKTEQAHPLPRLFGLIGADTLNFVLAQAVPLLALVVLAWRIGPAVLAARLGLAAYWLLALPTLALVLGSLITLKLVDGYQIFPLFSGFGVSLLWALVAYVLLVRLPAFRAWGLLALMAAPGLLMFLHVRVFMNYYNSCSNKCGHHWAVRVQQQANELNQAPVIGSLMSAEDLEAEPLMGFGYSQVNYAISSFLDYCPGCQVLNLSLHDTPDQSEDQVKASVIQASFFSVWVQKQPPERQALSLDVLRSLAVEELGIRHLLLSPGASLPPALKHRAFELARCQKTGWRWVYLHRRTDGRDLN